MPDRDRTDKVLQGTDGPIPRDRGVARHLGQPQPAGESACHAGRVPGDTRQTVAARHRGQGKDTVLVEELDVWCTSGRRIDQCNQLC